MARRFGERRRSPPLHVRQLQRRPGAHPAGPHLARTRALDPALWTSIAVVAPEVRGWRHQETLTYVQRIQANLDRMDARGRVVRRAPVP
ncbi:MAG: hypothetical protein IPJ57_20240 [Gemmatimonadetes bacterium]|nr:hypothetical protein [Gemmatimonadota bacterium]